MQTRHFQQQDEVENTTSHTKIYPTLSNQQPIEPINYPTLNINNNYNEQEQIVAQNSLVQYQNYNLQTPENQTQNNIILVPFKIQNTNQIDNNVDDGELMTHQQRKQLISKINLCVFVQHVIQLFFYALTYINLDYAELYFNYQEKQLRLSFYIISTLFLLFVLIVRFNHKLHQKKYQIQIFIIVSVLQIAFSSGLASCGKISSDLGLWYPLIGLSYEFGSFGILLAIIQFQCLFKKLEENQMLVNSFMNVLLGTPFIYMIAFGGGYSLETLLFLIAEFFYVLLFTFLYVSGLLQIYKGKFNLKTNQYLIGAVLNTSNMLLLFIP